jgi:uncharacterized membrane protein YbhN (UPF0104 family)
VKRYGRLASPAAGIGFFCLALWVLYHALADLRYEEIVAEIGRLPRPQLAAAALLAGASYAVLAGYDLLGFRFLRRAVPAGRVAHAAFIAFAFGNNFGHTLLTGATLRYWIHAPDRLSAGDTARLVLFCSLGFWLGYLFLAGLAFALEPIAVPIGLPLPFSSTRALGVALLAMLALYAALVVARSGARLRLRGWDFSLPSPALTAGQVALGALDLGMMSATLWVLLPAGASLTYLGFLPLFLLACFMHERARE